MTSPYVSDPPEELIIPVTKGCDFIFTVELEDESANPVNYTGPVYCYVENRGGSPQQVPATVADNQAAVRLPPTITDSVSGSSRWRVVMADETYTPAAEVPLLVGGFERHD